MINAKNISRIRTLFRSDRLHATRSSASNLPELAIRKEISVCRAYDEYCRRIESGESVDTEAFCAVHSEFRSALFRRIELHKFLDEHPDTLQYLEPIPWPKVGESFGNCTLIEELGYGGAGRVFLAREDELSRLIVLKLVAGDNGEAERLCRLKHPYIVPIYYVRQDRDSGLTAICMPFESRFTLNDLLDAAFQNRELPDRFGEALQELFPSDSNSECGDRAKLNEMDFIDGVLTIGRRLSEALEHSHRAGIYHLDLKPSNVLVKSDGTPLLIDFNLAVNAGQSIEVFGGTKPYMSPEQIRRLLFPLSPDVDGKSDVYSLAVMLCQILTGEHPFGAISWNGTEQQLLLRQQDWSPAELNRFPNIDGRIIRLLADCLAVAPERRIDSAELAVRMERILRDRHGGRFASRRRYLLLSTTLVAATATGVLSRKFLRQPDATQLYNDGVAQLASGQFQEAILALSQSIEIEPGDARAWSQRALAILQRGEDRCFVEALSDYEEAYRISGDPAMQACIGFCRANLREFGIARAHLQKAIDGGLESAELFNVLGYCQMQMTYYDDAEESFTKALGKKPNLQSALHNRALNELLRSDELNRELDLSAVSDIELALKAGEENPMILYSAACIWDRLPSNYPNRSAKILEYVDRSIELGFDQTKYTTGPQFQDFRGNRDFLALLEHPRPHRPVPSRPRLPHPLGPVGVSSP